MRLGWGRWRWQDTGWGRWHALADVAPAILVDENGVHHFDFAVTTACGRDRVKPNEVAAQPGDDVCPACATIDMLRSTYRPETADQPKEAVPA